MLIELSSPKLLSTLLTMFKYKLWFKKVIIVEFFLFYAAERSRSLEAYSFTSEEPPPISSISSFFL